MTNIKDDDLDNDRSIYLFTEVTEKSVLRLITSIVSINKEDEGLDIDSREPINLYINSPGGSVTDMLALLSIMESSETPIITHAVGQVMSAALLIYAVGTTRVAYKNSLFLYHGIWTGHIGDLTHIENQHAFSKNLQDRYNEYLLKYSSFTKEDLDEICTVRKDHFFDYREAINKGLVDEVEISDVHEEDMEWLKNNCPEFNKKTIDLQELFNKVPLQDLVDFLSEHEANKDKTLDVVEESKDIKKKTSKKKTT